MKKYLSLLAAVALLGGVARAQTTEAVTINKSTGAVVNANPSGKFNGANQFPLLDGSGHLQGDPAAGLAATYLPLSGSANITGDLGANSGYNWRISEATGAVSFAGGDFTVDGDGNVVAGSFTGDISNATIIASAYFGSTTVQVGIDETYAEAQNAYNVGSSAMPYFSLNGDAASALNNEPNNPSGMVVLDSGGNLIDQYGNIWIEASGALHYGGGGNGILTDNVGQLYWSGYDYPNTVFLNNEGDMFAANGSQVMDYAGDLSGATVSAGSRLSCSGFLSLDSGCITSDGVGNLALCQGLQVGNPQSFAPASHLYSGSGAPASYYGTAGDFYFRTDGTVGSRIYINVAGTWTGIL